MTSIIDRNAGQPAAAKPNKVAARAWRAGLAATLLLSCSAGALHAESNADLAREIAELKAQLREMRGAISAQRVETKRAVKEVKVIASKGGGYALPPPASPYPAGAVPAFVTADKKLQFGAITITPGGFLAGESVFRTRTLNSDVNSAFGAIPFNNNPLAHVNEFRPSARQSRFALLAEGAITPNVFASGYAEFDFLSATTTANSNQTNSYTPRIRNLYAALDFNDYGFHMLAGQNWSLLTLNSKGITPRNEVTPTVIDSAQSVGSIYARQPQIRIVKDFNKKLWLALSAEESETTFQPGCATGGAGTLNPNGGLGPANGAGGAGAGAGGINNIAAITCGAAGAGAFAPQTNYSLNHVPDVVGKVAYEAKLADRDVHLEVSGLYTNLYDRVSTTAFGTPVGAPAGAFGTLNSRNRDTSGYGVGAGIIAPILPKRLDFQINALYGRGIGRYGPGGISEATFNPDGSLKAVPELIALAGLTAHVTPAIDVYAYAGVEQTQRSYFTNPDGSFVGVGSPGINDLGCGNEAAAATTCNGSTKRLIELTGGFWDKVYKGSFGEVRAGVQYAYVRREIFNAPGFRSPSTDDHMVFTSLRYFPFQ